VVATPCDGIEELDLLFGFRDDKELNGSKTPQLVLHGLKLPDLRD